MVDWASVDLDLIESCNVSFNWIQDFNHLYRIWKEESEALLEGGLEVAHSPPPPTIKISFSSRAKIGVVGQVLPAKLKVSPSPSQYGACSDALERNLQEILNLGVIDDAAVFTYTKFLLDSYTFSPD